MRAFRPRWTARADRWLLASLLGLALLLALAILHRHDVGVTWDESLHLRYGRRILGWFASGFADRRALDFADIFEYGGLFDLLAELGVHFTPRDVYATRHLASALCAILGVVATWKIAARLGGHRAGFLAALMLTLTPVWFGHGMFNPKDIPFAAAAAWVAYGMLCFATDQRLAALSTCWLCGIALGTALGVRPGGMFLLCYPLVGLLARVEGLAAVRGVTPERVGYLTTRLLTCWGVAWFCMLIAWPWAQVSPLRRPFEAAWTTSHSPWNGPTLFRGAFIEAQHLPRSYLPTWFAITLPETYLLALGCALALVWVARKRLHEHVPALRGLSCIAFAAFAPLIAALVSHPAVYDAHRHFLFVLPPLAALAGLAISALLAEPLVPAQLRAATACALVVLLATVTLDMVRLHPYEYVYFNRLSGGLPAAQARFETDYWGVSYTEGMRWVGQHLAGDGDLVRVASCNDSDAVQSYLEDRPQLVGHLKFEKDPANADVFLATTRFNCHKTPGQVLHVVERMGVPLLYVIQTRTHLATH